jgi:hypothetical protein
MLEIPISSFAAGMKSKSVVALDEATGGQTQRKSKSMFHKASLVALSSCSLLSNTPLLLC